ncbi:MAG TPA: hypothetical protein VEA78_01985 [Acidimicrobiales bacterium]|nr:hypothetical protein [Acidimicrobiales bacterium]
MALDPFQAWVGVLQQGPRLSATNVFRREHMLAATPSPAMTRPARVNAGDEAPLADHVLERTDGYRFSLREFRGRPVVMRLTRAVTDRIV